MAAGGFDIGASMQGGANFINGLADRKRKDAAYNALRAAYGDIAGDPKSAEELAGIGQKDRLLDQGDRTYGLQRDEFGLKKDDAGVKAEDRRRGAILNGAQYVVSAMDRAKAAGANDADVGAIAITSFNQIAPQLGFSPEQTQQIRDQLAADPNSARDLVAALQGNDMKVAAAGAGAQQRYQYLQGDDGKFYPAPLTGAAPGGLAPLTGADGRPIHGYQAPQGQARIEQGWERLDPGRQGDIARAKGEGTTVGKGEGDKKVSDLPLSNTEMVKARTGFDSATQSFDVADKALDKALKDTGFASAGILSNIPGNTYAANLKADLDTVKSKVVFDTIAELKSLSKTGSTGFGQLSDREGDLIKARLGSVEQAQSPAALREALMELKHQLAMTRERLRNQFMGDLAARGQGGSPAPSADPTGGRIDGSNIILKWNAQTGKLE